MQQYTIQSPVGQPMLQVQPRMQGPSIVPVQPIPIQPMVQVQPSPLQPLVFIPRPSPQSIDELLNICFNKDIRDLMACATVLKQKGAQAGSLPYRLRESFRDFAHAQQVIPATIRNFPNIRYLWDNAGFVVDPDVCPCPFCSDLRGSIANELMPFVPNMKRGGQIIGDIKNFCRYFGFGPSTYWTYISGSYNGELRSVIAFRLGITVDQIQKKEYGEIVLNIKEAFESADAAKMEMPCTFARFPNLRYLW